MKIRNRIIGTGAADPRTLKENDLNWRTHPDQQREGLNALLGGVGWVDGVLVVQETGTLVDGHARVEEAIKAGETEIPVTYLDLTPEEEQIVLMLLDPSSNMAEADARAFETLVSSLDEDTPEVLAKVLEEETRSVRDALGDLAADEDDWPWGDDEEDEGWNTSGTEEGELVHGDVGDIRFSVPYPVFLEWRDSLFESVGFNKDDIGQEMLRRLGIELCD